MPAIYYGTPKTWKANRLLGITLPMWMGIGGMLLGF